MLIVMKGLVEYSYDPDESGSDPEYWGISPTCEVSIGGKDVFAHLQKHLSVNNKVTVTLMNQHWSGDIYMSDNDPGYSEVTPGSAADIIVGPHSLFDRLKEWDGKQVTLVIADRGVNIIAIQSGNLDEA